MPVSVGYFDHTSAATADAIAVAWLVPSPENGAPCGPIDAMSTPGAVSVRYGCRDENGATVPVLSTAPTDTTPRHTPGSSTASSSAPRLPLAANRTAPLRSA